MSFANSVIIVYHALTQPEHLIGVRWMCLETHWKRSWKPCVFGNNFKPVCKIFSICTSYIHAAWKTHDDKELYWQQIIVSDNSLCWDILRQIYLLLTVSYCSYWSPQKTRIKNSFLHYNSLLFSWLQLSLNPIQPCLLRDSDPK